MIRTFVYGTLKRGEYNHVMMGSDAVFIKDTFIKGRLLTRFIPFLFKGDRDIQGEIWDIPEANFKSIEYMELMAGYYTTEEIIDGEPTKVFRYPQEYLEAYLADPSTKEVSNFKEGGE